MIVGGDFKGIIKRQEVCSGSYLNCNESQAITEGKKLPEQASVFRFPVGKMPLKRIFEPSRGRSSKLAWTLCGVILPVYRCLSMDNTVCPLMPAESTPPISRSGIISLDNSLSSNSSWLLYLNWAISLLLGKISSSVNKYWLLLFLEISLEISS